MAFGLCFMSIIVVYKEKINMRMGFVHLAVRSIGLDKRAYLWQYIVEGSAPDHNILCYKRLQRFHFIESKGLLL